jgi:hypothetical protein
LIALAALLLALAAPRAAQAQIPDSLNLVRSVSLNAAGNGLVANLIDGQTVPISLAATPNPGGHCPILHLELQAITLNVLGLVVETSDICLAIDAESGPGNLLGNLLCAVARLLDQGVPLQGILNGLGRNGRQSLFAGLTDLINGAVGGAQVIGAQQDATGCPILNLALGPVDLDLLGLQVHLDDCANGPVTVDITAVPTLLGGGLLGDILCGLLAALGLGTLLALLQGATLANLISAILALWAIFGP